MKKELGFAKDLVGNEINFVKSKGPTGYSPKLGPWSISPTGYRYFTKHPLFPIFYWIAFGLMVATFLLGILLGSSILSK